ncbi:hypothetical protein EDB92DRAFT_1820958 [Lactarius akahatsu]|uniref:Uncharacterized protein n=1 Tax=Lactarius akahatsu TaxID=416441 RepID=A0AAD4LB00_9AGAM|nr:hypothetical protein EDB92DRAFT_1820958 [Lactarius akahatsu]
MDFAPTSFLMQLPSPRNMYIFSLSFEGDLPRDLDDAEMPMELTVHLLPEFNTLRPIIKATRTFLEHLQPSEELPSHSQWLIYYIQDQHLPHWKWGAEVFWTAFIATFPSFPLGNWPHWDVRIPFAGAFIEKRMVDFEEISQRASENTGDDLIRHCEKLWEDFCEIVKLMYPFPIHYNTSEQDRD